MGGWLQAARVLAGAVVLVVAARAVGAEPAERHRVTGFEVVQMDCMELATGRVVHATRAMRLDGAARYLVTDVEAVTNRLVAPAALDCQDPEAERLFERSRFGRVLFGATAAPYPTRNDGVRRAELPVQGLFLTADLCPAPASKFAGQLFDAMAELSAEQGGPVPMGVAITGGWLRNHAARFAELVALQQAGKVAVTWVNHSESHPFTAGLPDGENFLLTPGLDPSREIEAVEIALLERGQLPSPFFRFPGLVSDQRWVDLLLAYSLIPLGSDAWIAYGQEPTAGSVVLVHGNGNEPQGVTSLLRQLPRLQALGPFLPLAQLFGGPL
jgi:hypothetical protein